MTTQRAWKITGTKHGKAFEVQVAAADHNDAVRKGSHAPHMLVVTSAVLLDPSPEYDEGRHAALNGWGITSGHSAQYEAGHMSVSA